MRVTSNAVKRARQLRKHMSLPEVMLWQGLRGREPGKPVFRRQYPIGPYVLDFFCASVRLCVEIDGDSHSISERPQADARRDAYLRSLGIRTIRWSASEVISDANGAAMALLQIARETSAPSTASRSPSPEIGGGFSSG
jgi:very-short-patch-repair endonuclease